MSQAVKQNLIGMIVVAVLAAILFFAVVHGARGDVLAIEQGKFYVTVTLQDRDTDQRYAKLVFNPAGAFPDRDTCLAWVLKKDPEFIQESTDLLNQAREQFGPGVIPKIDCETPPAPPGEHV